MHALILIAFGRSWWKRVSAIIIREQNSLGAKKRAAVKIELTLISDAVIDYVKRTQGKKFCGTKQNVKLLVNSTAVYSRPAITFTCF